MCVFMVCLCLYIWQGVLSFGQWKFKYNFSYFYLDFLPCTAPRPVLYNTSVLLLDQTEFHYKNKYRFELGGDVARQEIGHAVAVHATCYEKTSKLLGLKAANAFWNVNYFTSPKRTLTKPLMTTNDLSELLREVRVLVYLAIKSNRSLIIPNVLIGSGLQVPFGLKTPPSPEGVAYLSRAVPIQRDHKRLTQNLESLNMTHAILQGPEYYWPAFRTIFTQTSLVEVLEPSYYYRVQEHYSLRPPEPVVLRWGSHQKSAHKLLAALLALGDADRVVIDVLPRNNKTVLADIVGWAKDSASSWGDNKIKKQHYLPMTLDTELHNRDQIYKILQRDIKMCSAFLERSGGNRTCFEKCM